MVVRSDRLESLASPAFIASLALLVVNDFALKPLFHNALTGKVSDFAGLFALTLFLATLWPRHRQLLGILVAAAFAFWKTTYADPLIESLNAASPIELGRTVDLTDLMALPMIPFAIWAAPHLRPWPLPRVLQLALAMLAPVAFTATSSVFDVTRTTATVPISTAVDEAAVQRFFDDVAAREQLRCLVCDPIGEGRIYGRQSEDGTSASKGIERLTVNFAADRREIYFVAADSSGRTERDLARFSEEIHAELDRRFPGLNVTESTTAHDSAIETTEFRVGIGESEQLTVELAESRRRALSSIVEEVVRSHGVQTAPTVYYAGRRRGVDWHERDFVLEYGSNANTVLEVRMRYYSRGHAELYRAVVDDFEKRLSSEFGPDNVKRQAWPAP